MNPEIANIKRPWTTKQSLLVALGCFIIGTTIFVISYFGATTGSGLGSFNQSILDFMIRIRQVNLTDYMSAITIAGSPATVAAATIAITLIWASYKREFWRPALLVVSMMAASSVAVWLKSLFMTARPLHKYMVPPYENFYAFPSGHTIGIFVVLIVIGYLICSRKTSVLRIISWSAITVIATAIVAFSRLYLGYHWLTDVLGSIGLGLIILSIIVFVDKITTNRFTKLQ